MPIHQSDEYREALALTETQTTRLQDGTLVLCRKMAGVQIAMLPRARLSKATLPNLIREAQLQRKVLILNPNHAAPWLADLGAVPLMSPQYIATLSLEGDIRARMHQKWRNRLVHAEQQNLRITRQNMLDKADQWLLQENQKQRRSRGYDGWPDALTLAYGRANRGRAKLFTAFDGNTPVAAMLFLLHGDSATYHIGHSTDSGRAAGAHNVLLWEATKWLASKGVRSLDLGLVSTEESPGLARFKLGTGATLHALGGSWLWWPPLGRTLKPLSFIDRRLMTPQEVSR